MKTTKKLKRMVAGVLASLMAMSGTANIWAADTEENVHLSMAFWADQSEIDRMDQLLEIWKADHPNVTLDYTYCAGPDYPTKLQVWFSSGKAPDVIRMSRDIFSPFASEDLFADLTPYLEASGSAGCWDESLLDIFDFNGELLSLPYLYSNYVIAYNKDIFDEANLEYPTADWTETEFVELAKTLTSGEGPEKTYGMWFGGWVCELVRALYGEPKMYDTENMVMQATNNEKFKAAFQLLGDLHKDGYCSNEVTKTTTTGGFVTGKYAMALAMTNDIGNYQKQIGDNFKWDIVELPISETYDTRWNTNMRLQGFGMSKTTEHPELAYDLIEYMTTNYEVQKAVDEEGVGIPALTEYLESEEFKTNYGGGAAYNKEAFVNMAKVGTAWEFAGIWADINDTLTSEFNAYITGATDIDTALDNLQKKGEAVIEAAKS
jgi:multiple sugar transport system substrate-binding protein